jgi:hypothetical protein
MNYLYHKIKNIVDQYNSKDIHMNYIPIRTIKPDIVYSHITGKPVFMNIITNYNTKIVNKNNK